MQSIHMLWTLINVFLVYSTMAYWQGKTDHSTDKCFCQVEIFSKEIVEYVIIPNIFCRVSFVYIVMLKHLVR